MADPAPREDEAVDHEFDDLLQELRVSQNGTQILFAFLLTVPFSNGFRQVTAFQRGLYFATLLLAALSAAMLIAPAAMHRLVPHENMKERLLVTAGRVAIGGQALLTLTVAGAVFLIGDYLYGHAAGAVLAVATLLWWSGWFYAIPLSMRRRQRSRSSAAS